MRNFAHTPICYKKRGKKGRLLKIRGLALKPPFVVSVPFAKGLQVETANSGAMASIFEVKSEAVSEGRRTRAKCDRFTLSVPGSYKNTFLFVQGLRNQRFVQRHWHTFRFARCCWFSRKWWLLRRPRGRYHANTLKYFREKNSLVGLNSFKWKVSIPK